MTGGGSGTMAAANRGAGGGLGVTLPLLSGTEGVNPHAERVVLVDSAMLSLVRCHGHASMVSRMHSNARGGVLARLHTALLEASDRTRKRQREPQSATPARLIDAGAAVHDRGLHRARGRDVRAAALRPPLRVEAAVEGRAVRRRHLGRLELAVLPRALRDRARRGRAIPPGAVLLARKPLAGVLIAVGVAVRAAPVPLVVLPRALVVAAVDAVGAAGAVAFQDCKE